MEQFIVTEKTKNKQWKLIKFEISVIYRVFHVIIIGAGVIKL